VLLEYLLVMSKWLLSFLLVSLVLLVMSKWVLSFLGLMVEYYSDLHFTCRPHLKGCFSSLQKSMNYFISFELFYPDILVCCTKMFCPSICGHVLVKENGGTNSPTPSNYVFSFVFQKFLKRFLFLETLIFFF